MAKQSLMVPFDSNGNMISYDGFPFREVPLEKFKPPRGLTYLRPARVRSSILMWMKDPFDCVKYPVIFREFEKLIPYLIQGYVSFAAFGIKVGVGKKGAAFTLTFKVEK